MSLISRAQSACRQLSILLRHAWKVSTAASVSTLSQAWSSLHKTSRAFADRVSIIWKRVIIELCKVRIRIRRFVRASEDPCLPRRVRVGITIAIWTAIILYLDMMLWRRGQPLVVAASVTFLLALFAFRDVAKWTFDAAVAWRAVDYPWVSAAVGTIVITTANFQLAAQRNEISALRSDIQISGNALVQSIDQLHSLCNKIESVTWDQPKATPSSDTTTLFERRRDFGSAFGCKEIPRIKDDVREQMAFPNWPSGRPWIRGYLDLVCDGTLQIQGVANTDYDRTLVVQMRDLTTRSRDGICASANSLDHTGQRFLDSDKQLASLTSNPLVGYVVFLPALFWWYVALAYAAGLRLGKVHAEILQERGRPKQAAS